MSKVGYKKSPQNCEHLSVAQRCSLKLLVLHYKYGEKIWDVQEKRKKADY
jgi:hypothetical protein